MGVGKEKGDRTAATISFFLIVKKAKKKNKWKERKKGSLPQISLKPEIGEKRSEARQEKCSPRDSQNQQWRICSQGQQLRKAP